MVSVSVLTVLLVVTTPLMINITNYYTESVFRSNLMESGKIAQEHLFDNLISAKVLGLTTDASGLPVLYFLVPVEVNNGIEVDFLDGNGDVHWGAVEASGSKLDTPTDPHRLTLQLVPTDSVTETEAGLDLNNDGDTADSFQVGSLLLQTTGGVQNTFTSGQLVIGEVGKGAFDIDGDGVPDQLIQVTGESFVDSNSNGIHDDGEVFADANLNGVWDGSITTNLLVFGTNRDGLGHRFIYNATFELLNY